MYAQQGADLIDIFAGGQLDAATSNWLQEQSMAMRSTLSDVGQGFFNKAREMYQMISVSDAAQVLRNLTAKLTNVWSNNSIYAIHDLAGLQTAGPVMQRYIMAHVDLRKMYLNQEVEGYADSYVNYHGDAVGTKHLDYRLVTDGMVFVTDEEYRYTNYGENLAEGEEPLTLHQKVDVLRSWNLVTQYLEEGVDDPSSSCGAKL